MRLNSIPVIWRFFSPQQQKNSSNWVASSILNIGMKDALSPRTRFSEPGVGSYLNKCISGKPSSYKWMYQPKDQIIYVCVLLYVALVFSCVLCAYEVFFVYFSYCVCVIWNFQTTSLSSAVNIQELVGDVSDSFTLQKTRVLYVKELWQ